MMLPEHKEAYIEQNKRLKDVERPVLDEQAIEEVARKLAEAAEFGHTVRLMIYDRSGPIHVNGFVQQLDAIGGRIKWIDTSGKTWVPFRDILEVRLD